MAGCVGRPSPQIAPAQLGSTSRPTTSNSWSATTPLHRTRSAGNVPSPAGRGSPDPIPGFLLARLALQRSQQGRGAGGELLVAALQTTLDAIRIGGGRVIVVDAIDDAAHGFYEHFGFRPTPSSPGRLVMKASTAAASLGNDWT